MRLFKRNQEATLEQQIQHYPHQGLEPIQQQESNDFNEFIDENQQQLANWESAWSIVSESVDNHLHNPQTQDEYRHLINERLFYQQETIRMPDGSELQSRSRRFAVKDAFKKDLPLRITRAVIGAKLAADPATSAAYQRYEQQTDQDDILHFDLSDDFEETPSGIDAARSITKNIESELLPYVTQANGIEEQVIEKLKSYINADYSNLAGFLDWIVDAPAAGGHDGSPMLQILAKIQSQGQLNDLLSPAMERYADEMSVGTEHECLVELLDEHSPDKNLREWILFAAGSENPTTFMLQRIGDWPADVTDKLEVAKRTVLNQLADAIDIGITKYGRRIHKPATLLELQRIDQLIEMTMHVNESKKSSRKAGATSLPKQNEFSGHIDVREPEVLKNHRSAVFVRSGDGYEIVHNGEAQKLIDEKIEDFIREINGSAKMAEDVRNMIEHVVSEPIGRGKIKYQEHKRRVNGRAQPLRLRRINPVKTPGLKINEESKQIRIIYAFDNKGHNGKSAVVIEGIYAHGRGYEERISRA